MKMERPSINQLVRKRANGRILGGPFKGMNFDDKTIWGSGDLTAKLLGCYEQELHNVIRLTDFSIYDAIVNIGCAEGYYAVGLALLSPSVPVYAYDSNTEAGTIVARNSALNGVEGRIEVRGECSGAEIINLAQKHERLFVMCDCEGYELALFPNLDVITALQKSDIIIECHDILNPVCTPTMIACFWSTHRINIIYSGGRDAPSIPMLDRYGDQERWEAVCETRPAVMNWLHCQAR